MRAILTTVALLTLSAVVGCGEPAGAQADEVAALKKRITKLENRVRALEGRGGKGRGPARGKAPGRRVGPPPNALPPRPVMLAEGVKAAVLVNPKGKVKLPNEVSPGKYNVMAALGEGTLQRKNTVVVPKGRGPMLLECDQAKDTCSVSSVKEKPAPE